MAKENETELTTLPTMNQLQLNLDNCLRIIDDELLKGYVADIDKMQVAPVEESDFEEFDDVQFFRITELVYQEEEFSPYKLASVFSALRNKPCTLHLVIKFDGKTNEIYLGVRSLEPEYSTGTMRKMLERTLKGHFPGTKVEAEEAGTIFKNDYKDSDIGCISSVTGVADYRQDVEELNNENYIQGIEKFINGMNSRRQSKPYTAVFMARSLNHNDLNNVRKEYEDIYTQISPFANMQISYTKNTGTSSGKTTGTTHTTTESAGKSSSMSVSSSTNDTLTRSQSQSKGNTMTSGTSDSSAHGSAEGNSVSHGTSESESLGHSDFESSSIGMSASYSQGHSLGYSLGFQGTGINGGRSSGVSFGVSATRTRGSSDSVIHTYGTSETNSTSKTISETLSHGISKSEANSLTDTEGTSTTKGNTSGFSVQEGSTDSTSKAFSLMDSDTLSETFGETQGITLNATNMALQDTLKRISLQLERLDKCESIGMWNFSAYFLGESADEAETAAYMYQSVIMGNNSGVETSAVNTWYLPYEDTDESDGYSVADFETIYRYLKHFTNPEFFFNGFSYTGERIVSVVPTSRVSTNELAIHMGLPGNSVKGLPVTRHAAFAQEVISSNNKDEDDYDELNLGNVYNLGDITSEEVRLNKHSLTMHTFITGSTGSGKSNTVYQILYEARKNGVHFLVVEPAKGEYKDVFGNDDNVSVYGTNPDVSELLRLNPFIFPKQVHIFEHMERLVEIFNVCWPMYAAMPAVLKSAIECSYIDCGWDLTNSTNKYGDNLYPNFSDVARNIKTIIDSSEYDAENKGAYKGSLLTRLSSLTNGINGLIFTADEIKEEDLFDKNVIVDLSRVGSSETKSLLMGILVLKLQEYRSSQRQKMLKEGNDSYVLNSDLRHLTVLEEAHNLLKRTSTEQPTEGGNLLGKSVEMLSNAIAEMRTYGEGFIIADQAPGLMDMSAIRNTNTKIIMRLPDEDDRELVGRAANLNDDQIKELAKLPCGVAAIYQNEWLEPVLCKVHEFKNEQGLYNYQKNENHKAGNNPRTSLDIAELLINKSRRLGLAEIKETILPEMEAIGLSAYTQVSIMKLLSESQRMAKMTTLAPIIAELFPTVVQRTKEVCNESNDYREWTKATDNALMNLMNSDIDRRTRWGIIQLSIIYELITIENNEKAFRDWKHNGGLRW